MAPASVDTITQPILDSTPRKTANGSNGESKPSVHKEPLKLSGALDGYKKFDVTPVIGREFQDVDLAEWLRAPNSNDLIRDLAITISQRGVVFFRTQDNLTDDLQKELAQRLGQLTGKPESSGLHVHPVLNTSRGDSGKDEEISIISSVQFKQLYKGQFLDFADKKQSSKESWHSDITFEPVPSDYAILRLVELPGTGGDTLWASGYELYDRISTPYQKFLDSLTATYAQPGFGKAATANGFSLFEGPRGSPDNVGSELTAQHPVVRTNPVTGWKSVFAVGSHCQSINGLTPAESRHLLEWFKNLIVENHDLQVRHRWANPNDLAIWDNRSVYHAATPDYEGLGERLGHRAVGLGERPYFDPESKSRREALREEAIQKAEVEEGKANGHGENGVTEEAKATNGHTEKGVVEEVQATNGHVEDGPAKAVQLENGQTKEVAVENGHS